MFGNDSKPSRVFAYGAKIDKASKAIAQERLFQAHQYRNQLVALELDRRAKVDSLLVDMSPMLAQCENDLAMLESTIEQLIESAKKYRIQAQTKKDDPAIAAALKDAKAQRKELAAKRKELRRALFADPVFKDRQQAIELDFRNAWKFARANCGLHCGHYLTIEQARGGDRSGAPPRFMRFDGNGKISVQVQNGGYLRDAVAGGTGRISRYLQIDEPTGKGFGGGKWRTGRIRIGSDEKRQPLWLEFRTHLHRDIPPDAQVKWAWLQAKRIGTNTKWQLQLVLAQDEWQAKPCGDGAVAIMPGWASVADGIQAATWVGSDGAKGHIVIPKEQLLRIHKCRDLQEIRDRNFNDIRERLTAIRDKAPEWWQEYTEHMAKWRAPAKLAALIHKWRDDRFSGDAHLYAQAEAWRKQDKHLYDWQTQQQSKVQRWRKTFYRQTAAKLAQDYGTVLLPKIDWKTFATKAAVGEDDGKRNAPDEYRRLAAVSFLCDALNNRIHTDVIDANGIAGECGNCGEPWETHACGLSDQKESECLNMLRRFWQDDQVTLARFFKGRSINHAMKMAKGA